MTEIAMTRHLGLPYEEAVRRVKAALAEEGFGVLTEIDVRSTLREKLGLEFMDYVIIGACNPALAHHALEADLSIGALLPCNVVVYAGGEGTTLSIFDPEVGMGLAGSAALKPIAAEARARLRRVLESVEVLNRASDG
jgi:uncharacterized protein (DUF302 family)